MDDPSAKHHLPHQCRFVRYKGQNHGSSMSGAVKTGTCEHAGAGRLTVLSINVE
jgi:hypothetical protein